MRDKETKKQIKPIKNVTSRRPVVVGVSSGGHTSPGFTWFGHCPVQTQLNRRLRMPLVPRPDDKKRGGVRGGRRVEMATAVRAAVWAIVLSLAVLSCAEAGADVAWNNSPIDDNNLGRVARGCSGRHCHAGVSGLDLWLSLQEVSEIDLWRKRCRLSRFYSQGGENQSREPRFPCRGKDTPVLSHRLQLTAVVTTAVVHMRVSFRSAAACSPGSIHKAGRTNSRGPRTTVRRGQRNFCLPSSEVYSSPFLALSAELDLQF